MFNIIKFCNEYFNFVISYSYGLMHIFVPNLSHVYYEWHSFQYIKSYFFSSIN